MCDPCMTRETPIIDCEAIRGTFGHWRAEQEPLAHELSESLAALSAFQSHLDAWQQQLAHERERLGEAAGTAAELHAAREKIASLTGALLARTEELRLLDSRRAEVVTELELARAREKDLHAKLEEMKQARQAERGQSADELRHMRELLERRLEVSVERPVATADSPPASTLVESAGRPAHSPVLGSIVEQFGKLRQQRALDRPVHKTR
jgi:chromosome segregation ATPase